MDENSDPQTSSSHVSLLIQDCNLDYFISTLAPHQQNIPTLFRGIKIIDVFLTTKTCVET